MRADHIFQVSTRLPEPLRGLRELALDLSTVGDERVEDLFRRVDPAAWDAGGLDGLRLLASVPQERLDALAGDAEFVAGVERTLDEIRRAHDAPRWFQLHHRDELGLVAYFSLEFGLVEALPVYSGGLGVLAGDHLKAAADLGVPLVGVGLFYHSGYLQQVLDRTGWQHERYRQLNPHDLALAPTPDAEVVVDLAGVPTHARAWRADIGRVRLYLLDTDVEANSGAGRAVTDRLYGGDREQRLRQEMLLGMGGVQLLERLGLAPEVLHMNEGHAAFLGLERIRRLVRETGLDFDAALEAARPGLLFTVHTPVPAGIDRFPRELIERYFSGWAQDCGIGIDRLMDLGHEPGTEPGAELNLAALGLRLAGAANGVSRIHGAVSRRMFAAIWPQVPEEFVPIGSVTNGVDGRTWASREMADLFDRQVGPDWSHAGPDEWARLAEVGDEELWSLRRTNRERLVEYARRRARRGLMARGMSEAETAWCDEILDPTRLTMVFARRFAPYKRATLPLHDLDRLRALLRSPDRPVQLIFAGKAHPADDDGKRLLRQVAELATDVEWRDRFVFLDDYDLAVARMLVRGADLWLNTPIRLMEACGTSGMKAAINGGLNCSILDGWWDELFDGDVGWAIPSAEWVGDAAARDAAESAALLTVLEREVVPAFYERGDDGIPGEWLRRMRASLTRIVPRVGARRMVEEYVEDWYLPAAQRARRLARDDHRAARELVDWRRRITDAWPAVAIHNVTHSERATVGSPQQIWADVSLGGLAPEEVDVQLWHGRIDGDDELLDAEVVPMAAGPGAPDGCVRFAAEIDSAAQGSFGFSVRVVPSHPELRDDVHLPLVSGGPAAISCLD